jgi:hypothetical protein
MKSLLAVIGAGFIAATMLAQPADAAPRCVWKGTYWQCWNGHAWFRDHSRHAEFRHGRWMGRDTFYGSSAPVGRDMHRFDRHHGDWRYGR